MTYLLDTNAVAEPGRRAPDTAFMAWFHEVDANALFISTISIGEMRRGIALVEDAPRRRALERGYADVVHLFADRILPVDLRVAEAWGDLSARLRRADKPAGASDEIIAAFALAHGLTLVTRNTRHFEASGCKMLSPWSAESRG